MDNNNLQNISNIEKNSFLDNTPTFDKILPSLNNLDINNIKIQKEYDN